MSTEGGQSVGDGEGTACRPNSPATDADSDAHDDIRINAPQCLMLSDDLTEIDVADNGRVEQEERNLGVHDLHGIQLSKSITC